MWERWGNGDTCFWSSKGFAVLKFPFFLIHLKYAWFGKRPFLCLFGPVQVTQEWQQRATVSLIAFHLKTFQLEKPGTEPGIFHVPRMCSITELWPFACASHILLYSIGPSGSVYLIWLAVTIQALSAQRLSKHHPKNLLTRGTRDWLNLGPPSCKHVLGHWADGK